uniref:Uncharacterized protein n=1 Tax=Anguilla anguilla TaxID=7936 RepID=A0A0E9RB70_ANGAN
MSFLKGMYSIVIMGCILDKFNNPQKLISRRARFSGQLTKSYEWLMHFSFSLLVKVSIGLLWAL